jgi:lysozyme
MPDIKMTPGNRNPGRYRKTTLSLAMVALITAGASAPQLSRQFLGEKENTRLTAYPDGEGIWTICTGLTTIDGIRVKKDDQLTPAQCQFYDEEHQSGALKQMQKKVRPEIWAQLSEPAKTGISSFCITNIGPGKCGGSTFLRMLNSGASRNDYCAQITNWIRDRGRDCRATGSNCQGQPIRRMQEDELCLIPSPALELTELHRATTGVPR